MFPDNNSNDNSMKDRRLGRGIASLLANDLNIDINFSNDENADIKKINSNFVDLDINDIKPNPNQPRKYFDDTKLRELSDSIKHSGLLQPIIVSQKNEDGKYIIVAGERRYRASKLAGLNKIKSIILDINEQEILKNAILENVQREDLNPVEEANGYKKIIDTFNYTHEQLAKEIGKSRAHITNLLRILTLPDEVLSAVKNNNISLGHAKVLLSVNNPMNYLDAIIEKQLSVRQLEKMIENGGKHEDNDENIKYSNNQTDTANITFEMIKQLYSPMSTKETEVKLNTENVKKQIKENDSDWQQVENNIKIIEKQLTESCGFNIHLILKQDGSGKLEIDFSNAEDLIEIVKLFK